MSKNCAHEFPSNKKTYECSRNNFQDINYCPVPFTSCCQIRIGNRTHGFTHASCRQHTSVQLDFPARKSLSSV